MNLNIREILKKYFNHDDFIYPQEEIIRELILGNDVFVLLPTGGGKSLCYQLPAVIFEGITIVISPLVALMKDQVDKLNDLGIKAYSINYLQNNHEQEIVKLELQRNNVKLLYISPERLANPEFMSFLLDLKISLFAIDEAHCICQWGYGFRPDYLNLRLIRRNFPKVPLVALTATANSFERNDIIKQLNLKSPKIYINSFNRPNLFYMIYDNADKYTTLRNYLIKHKSESGIIYCLTRSNTENLTDILQNNGFNAEFYHGGINDPLIKTKIQNDFKSNKLKLIVATTAFGMGIDKPDIRFVIHYDFPRTIEDYYQQTGRAGRDGKKSDCILFFDASGVDRIEKEIKQGFYPQLKRGDIVDPLNLARRLKEGSDPISNYIKEKFSPKAEQLIYQFDGSSSPSEELIGTMIEGLNILMKDWGLLNYSKTLSGQDLEYNKNYTRQNSDIRSEIRSLFEEVFQNELAKRGEKIEIEKYIRYEKLSDMVDLCKSDNCRRKYILNYFGEIYQDSNCRNCDNCIESSLNLIEADLELSCDKKSPQIAGSSLVWTANSSSSDYVQIFYKFWIKGPSAKDKWTSVTDWSPNNQWVWNTKPSDVGEFEMNVDVTDDHFFQICESEIIKFRIKKINLLPIIVNLEPNLISPQRSDTVIIWTVHAEDPEKDPIRYKFWIKGPVERSDWRAATIWSSDNVCKWIPRQRGKYQIRVWIRDGHHAKQDGFDDEKNAEYTII